MGAASVSASAVLWEPPVVGSGRRSLGEVESVTDCDEAEGKAGSGAEDSE